MTQRTALHGSTAIFLAFAGAAQADVSARDVWENIQNYYNVAGYQLEPGSITEAGDTLTVQDLAIKLPNNFTDMQEELEVDLSAAIPRIDFKERPDGSVEISMSDAYSLTVAITPDGEDTGRFGIDVNQAGMSLIASGDPDKVTYDLQGPAIDLTLGSVEIPGNEDAADAVDASVKMGEYSGRYVVGGGDMPTLDMDLSIASAELAVKVREAGGSGGRFDMAMNFDGIDWNSQATLAKAENPGDLAGMLRAGMKASGRISHQGSSYSVDFEDGSDRFALEGGASSGSVSYDMGGNVIGYRIGNTDMHLKMSGSEIPLPEVTLSAGATAFGLTMPVLASEEPQDMALVLRLEDLVISDMIWGLLDPAGQLPRDPATLIVELSGKANWLVDIIDPMAVAEADVEMPGALHALDIDNFKLALIGAAVTAKGAFTFDMNDMTTFDGMPAPTGFIDVQLDGANALMDKLVGMGLLPQDQSMMARMMLGAFARPGEGPDSLVSKIEIDGATGGIKANGQPLQ